MPETMLLRRLLLPELKFNAPGGSIGPREIRIDGKRDSEVSAALNAKFCRRAASPRWKSRAAQNLNTRVECSLQ